MTAALVVAGCYGLVMLVFWRTVRNADWRQEQSRKPYATPTLTEIGQFYEMAGVPMPQQRRISPPVNYVGDRVVVCLPEQPVDQALDAYLALIGHPVEAVR